MKVQIVYLSPEDDIHSTRDMLGWVKAPRALLVWPDHGRVLTRRLDLVLLKRYSTQRQIEIGLLTFDREIREEASGLGIPVFDSLDHLPEENWTSSHPEQVQFIREVNAEPERSFIPFFPESSSRWFENLQNYQKVFLISLVTLSLIAIISLLMPSAVVVLSPSLVTEYFAFNIDLPERATGNPGTDLLPIQPVSLQVEGEATGESSGLEQVPISAATGKVIFTSMSAEILEIPIGTTLQTNAEKGVRFRTTQLAVLEPEIGSQVEVPIEAIIPGWSGNVPTNSITLVEGSLGLLVQVSNQEPTVGGQAEIRAVVLQVDLEQIEEELIQTLTETAKQIWSSSQPSDQVLVEGSLELQEVLERECDHAPGDVAETISLRLSLEFSALNLSIKELTNLMIINYSDELPPNHLPVPGTYRFSPQIQEAIDESDRTWINVSGKVDTYPVVDVEYLKRMIRGLRLPEATNLLSRRYQLSAQPEFVLKPSWYPIIPVVAQRIEINWSWEIGT